MRAASAVREEIKRYIVEHRLRPGDPMPTELVLCEELGVSRSSVREAMSQLHALDIVSVQQGRGTFVGDISLAPLVDSVTFRCLADHRSASAALRDIIEVRRALDIGQASAVTQAMRGRRHPDLHRLVDEMVAKASRGERFPDEDRAFHLGLQACATSNPLASNLIGAFWDIHTAVITDAERPDAAGMCVTAQAHASMLEAAEAGDGPAFVEAVCAHYEPLLRVLAH